jgi:osmotically-inducible protein OsmY
MRAAIQKTDTEIKTQVLSELQYEPSVKATDIGVLVKDGTVTLNGYATSYGEKWNAVRATKRVAGVNGIADDIEVKLPDSFSRNDGDIAAAAANQINSIMSIPRGTVNVIVRDGRVVLEGEVEWWFERNTAEEAVQHLTGIKMVTNMIKIKPKLMPTEVERDIKLAFERNALVDAKNIHVETSGNKVTLRGNVKNWAEREEAERAAWASSGVFSVDDQLKVVWS